MAEPTGRRFVAGLLSMLVPGLGQVFVGARRRGLILLGATVLTLGVLALAVSAGGFWGVDRKLVALILAVDVSLLALRLFAVLDASRGGWALGLVALVALTAAPHV